MSSNVVLTHPLIRDGWFREESPQWPGQAMSLRVRRILHHEKSLFQDVLVFESETYGNVLVLDGAIQCTERDEFSYQEMIAHLPINSHPNPRRVLVIGGGDGGVLREIVKHDMVEEAVLCDIDEAVPRVSKQYLPRMAEGLSHPKSRVIIGDGFAFLKDPQNQGSFDVIITDSSDPDGPAEVLFQKPYFELLKGALRPGGHISTQAESMWLHLQLIRSLTQSTKELFPVADYAYTMIPTYPCGQIGFVVCSLDPERNVREPLRTVPHCSYYNNDIHRAAFVLPQFAHRVIMDGEPAPAPVVATGDVKRRRTDASKPKSVLVLGSGYVAAPVIEYLLRFPELSVTIGSARHAAKLGAQFPKARTVQVDVQRADWGSRPENQQSAEMFELITGLIAGLVLLLGGLGLVNIQLVAMRQRIREIGVRRSFGATSGRIFTAVLLENIVATAVAGIVGIALAIIVMRVLFSLEVLTPLEDNPPFPLRAAFVALAAAVGIGAIAGFLPALAAVRDRLVAGLRALRLGGA